MSHRHSPLIQRPAVLTGALLCLCAPGVRAGSLDAPSAPDTAGSAMYTLDALYNRLDTGAVGSKRGATFAEPSDAPAPTMYDLDDLMAKMPALNATNGAAPGDVANGKTYWGLTAAGWGPQTGTGTGTGVVGTSAAVPKTGQTTCFDASGTVIACSGTGQDGAWQKGVPLPSPRFTDNGNGTVTDNLTGLIWLKNANCFGIQSWANALTLANGLADSQCGLSDGSTAGTWRLPNIKELQSLVDFSRGNPALSSGHPFSDVQSHFYWTSSTYLAGNLAWVQDLSICYEFVDYKSYAHYVWPVRGGQ